MKLRYKRSDIIDDGSSRAFDEPSKNEMMMLIVDREDDITLMVIRAKYQTCVLDCNGETIADDGWVVTQDEQIVPHPDDSDTTYIARTRDEAVEHMLETANSVLPNDNEQIDCDSQFVRTTNPDLWEAKEDEHGRKVLCVETTTSSQKLPIQIEAGNCWSDGVPKQTRIRIHHRNRGLTESDVFVIEGDLQEAVELIETLRPELAEIA